MSYRLKANATDPSIYVLEIPTNTKPKVCRMQYSKFIIGKIFNYTSTVSNSSCCNAVLSYIILTDPSPDDEMTIALESLT